MKPERRKKIKVIKSAVMIVEILKKSGELDVKGRDLSR